MIEQTNTPFSNLQYDIIFEDQVLDFLNSNEVKETIADYIEKYNELLDNSRYFRRDTFNYYNAKQIAKTLANNGFFDAKHSVNLNSTEILEITSPQQLEDLIADEESKIADDEDLKRKFAKISNQLERNKSMRNFQAHLDQHPHLLPRLGNVDSLRQDIWKSYIKSAESLYVDLLQKYSASEQRKIEIEAEAKKQVTRWENVISIFNDRFFVPFRLDPKNKEAVILGNDPILNLSFVYQEDSGNEKTPIEKNTLMEVLSTGERKALYILNSV